MMSINLVGVLIPGVALISLATGLVFGIAGTVFHMNRKKTGPIKVHTNTEEMMRQAVLASVSLSVRKR